MKNNLILTGWSKSEYLAAAAAAFEALKADADVKDQLDALCTYNYPHAKSVFDKNNQNLTVTKEALGISLNTLKKYLA